MDNLSYGKWAGWVALSLLSLIVNVISQPGFFSINCGGKTNISAQNGITWVTDAYYIDVGNTEDIVGSTGEAYDFPLYSLRFFPKPLTKSCYQFPVVRDVPYLLRLWFSLGTYSGYQQWPSFAFSIETLGLLAFQNVSITSTDLYYYEYVLVSSGSVLYICLIRTSDTDSDNPFINAIELRTLREGMYAAAKPGTMLVLIKRMNVGGNSTLIRYPLDSFDRFWITQSPSTDTNLAVPVTTLHPISSENTNEFPPSAVMQTAWVVNNSETNGIRFPLAYSQTKKTLVMLYFAEMEMLNPSESRSFYITINGVTRSNITKLVRNYSAIELTFLTNDYTTDSFTVDIDKATGTTLAPIINAYEYYLLSDTQPATYSQDVEALNAIKNKFHIQEWISDPCYLIEWAGIRCHNRSMGIRISEMNLSGNNLRGSIPEDIGQLTALVNLSLDNNHLIGSLPNFSNLTMLERLCLHNNHLSGGVPEWLSKLKNLKELFIENNNFSGVIPAQLFNEFLNNSLKLKYFGNPYLFKPLPNSKKSKVGVNSKNSKVGVVLGISLSGILIITVALLVGTALYRKKFRRKEGVPTSVVEPDYSTIMVPNPTKSRAFTRDDILAATQNFSKKIGRGGFGWVFFGQLPEGKEIAVKVLSIFSTQGVTEFLNEVDLLSRIHHRNLVSLLGYCNESRELMLIYEYMSRGCLKDHLYGDSARISQLHWRRRVKIVLDVAQGLEYLHMGCTPKIIHRDMKTTNILLDNNFNGKMVDFGLSKMTIDGEATHITTTVKGTAGYLDPEYFNSQTLTEKSDVYSFGVVLFEIICGRKPIDVSLPNEEINLIQWVRKLIIQYAHTPKFKEYFVDMLFNILTIIISQVTPYVEMDENHEKMAEIIDKRLVGNYDMNSIIRVAKLAIRCVHVQPSYRPSMIDVVGELRETTKHDSKASKDIGVEYLDVEENHTYLMVGSSRP